jgi:hypothetical protein
MSTEAGPSTSSAPRSVEEMTNDLTNAVLEEQESASEAAQPKKYARGENPKLRYKKPYWWAYKTFVKQRYVPAMFGESVLTLRWIGRELLEVISTEFRDRSVEYYVSRIRGVQS